MLHDHEMTRHAEARVRQRGVRDADLDLLLETASQVASDEYMLTDSDAAREIAHRKHEIQQLERMKGFKVVVAGKKVITCYPVDRRHQRAARRRSSR